MIPNSGFTLKLFVELLKQKPNENIFFSPLSINLALLMAANGAAGNTREEILNLLGTTEAELEGVNQWVEATLTRLTSQINETEINLANALFYQFTENIKPEYVETCQKYFMADVSALNFSDRTSLKVVNGWVNEKTKGKITEILEYLSASTSVILLNAIYFKAKWLLPFSKEITKAAPFYLTDGASIQHPMMHQTEEQAYYKGTNFQAVCLYYKDKKNSLLLFLPNKGVRKEELIAELMTQKWSNWGFQFKKVQLSLPNFKVEYSTELVDILATLGICQAFTLEANFQNLIEPKAGLPTYIGKIIHKSFVQVDEEGTEAAAITAIELERGGPPPSIIMLEFNRPFVYAVMDEETDTILFLGYLENPATLEN